MPVPESGCFCSEMWTEFSLTEAEMDSLTLSMALEAVGTSYLPLTHHSIITADVFPA